MGLGDGCVCSLAVIVTAFVLDPLCGHPGSITNDFPTTLRATSIVLISLLASPPITRKSLILEQRLFLGLLVAIAAFAGENRGEFAAKAVDAMFVFLALSSCVISSVSAAVSSPKPNDDAKMQTTNENLCALFGATLVYIGARLCREAFFSPQETLDFKITKDDFAVRGFALIDELTLATKAINGALFASVGMIVLLTHNDILKYGVPAVASTCKAIACLTFTTTFVGQFVAFDSMSRLPAIFSADSCLVGAACDVATRSRRQHVASQLPLVSLCTTLALGIFSLPKAHQRTERKHSIMASSEDFTTFVCLAVATTVPVFILIAGPNLSQLQVELMFSLIAVALVASNATILGCCLYLISSVLHVSRVTIDFAVITDVSYVTSMACTGVLILIISINTLLYSTENRLYSKLSEKTGGVVITLLLSVNTLLFLVSVVLFASSTGALRTGNTKLLEDGLTFYLKHFCPVFFAGSLFANRHEVDTLPRSLCRVAWFVPVLALGTVYATAAVSADGSYAGYEPVEDFVDVFSFGVGTTSAVVSWAAVGMFV